MPYVNQDQVQLDVVTKFLQDGIVTVDIFAVSPVKEDDASVSMRRRAGETPMLSTGFAVGEEAESGARSLVLREVGEIAAPIDRAAPVLAPGDNVKVDVVVRTRKVGHFFPGGTVDSFDVWVELQAVDATGRIIYWSGKVEDDGRGLVEPGAHFYRAFLLDAHSNPINKRNAFQARSLLYAQLIPPGAADTAHFRMTIPPDAQGPIRLLAKLNYRKFSHYYTQFSYAGQPDPADDSPSAKTSMTAAFFSCPKTSPPMLPGRSRAAFPRCRSSRSPRLNPKFVWGLRKPTGDRGSPERTTHAGMTTVSVCCVRAISKARSTPSNASPKLTPTSPTVG